MGIAGGLIALVWSADRFVEGASAIAKRAGLTPMLIGLTIVSLGTSPEVLISVMSSLADSGELAVGNALGSNIANIGLVLGELIVSPITLSRGTTLIDLPLLIVVVILTGAYSMIWSCLAPTASSDRRSRTFLHQNSAACKSPTSIARSPRSGK